MVNAKKKGNRGENLFSEFLRDNGFKAYRDSASGASTHKSDIVNGLDYSMEIKTVKKINLLKAWRQVDSDSSKARNVPLLAIHFDGMGEKEWLVCLHSSDWIELEKNKSNPVKIDRPDFISNQRELAWAMNNLKVALTKVLKLLE